MIKVVVMGFFNKLFKKEKSGDEQKIQGGGIVNHSQKTSVDLMNDIFLVPVIYAGEKEELFEPDKELHVFMETAIMMNEGKKLVSLDGIPEGYYLARKAGKSKMHIRMLKNTKTQTEFIPLFISFETLFQFFGRNIHVGLIGFEEAKKLCINDQSICSGIIVAPGILNKCISTSELLGEARKLSKQEIVEMARKCEPLNIYAGDGILNPEVRNAVNEIFPLYDGISSLTTLLMLNKPELIRKNMENADVHTLLLFFKYLAVSANNIASDITKQQIGILQEHTLLLIQKKYK